MHPLRTILHSLMLFFCVEQYLVYSICIKIDSLYCICLVHLYSGNEQYQSIRGAGLVLKKDTHRNTASQIVSWGNMIHLTALPPHKTHNYREFKNTRWHFNRSPPHRCRIIFAYRQTYQKRSSFCCTFLWYWRYVRDRACLWITFKLSEPFAAFWSLIR